MVPPITHYFVNWIDGMKINREHFVSEQNASLARLRDVAALGLTPFNYGILPPLPNTRSGLDIQIVSDRINALTLRLTECRGITPGGQRVEISQSNQIALAGESYFLEEVINLNESRGRDFLVVVSVNPLKRVPLGDTNPEENPPRNPFITETMFLNVLPEDEVVMSRDGLYHLTIGKLQINGNSAVLDDNYIPPVTAMSASPDLVEMSYQAEKKLAEFEENVVTIIQKIFAKKQTDDLPQTALEVCREVRAYLSASMFAIRGTCLHLPPVTFFEFFGGLARTMKNALDSREGSGKEPFLSYIRAWVIETSQAEFEHLIDQMVANRYHHMDILKSVQAVQSFTRVVFSVFAKLAELDFLGDKKVKGPIDIDQSRTFQNQNAARPTVKKPML